MNLKKIVGRFPSPFFSLTWKYWKSWLEFQRWKKQLTNYMPIGQISSRGIRGRVGTGKKGVCLTCFTSRDKKEAKDEATRWSSWSFTGCIKVQWWYWIWFVTTIPFTRIHLWFEIDYCQLPNHVFPSKFIHAMINQYMLSLSTSLSSITKLYSSDMDEFHELFTLKK
jgi:hypothetical protein